MSNQFQILGVSEIVISVADLPKMKAFYCDIMGFSFESESCHERSIEADPNGEPTIVFLKIAATDTALGRNGHPQLLALIDHRRHIFARERLTGHDPKTSTLNHLAFEIPSHTYEYHLERLKELNLEPTETTFANMQAKSIFFNDPEGNRLELICHWPN